MPIPKIIHQLWIGPKQRPVRLMNTWKEKNPSFMYKIWTEDDLHDFPFKNQKLIDMMPELNGKCDIMRYELLYHFGGFFVDADIECVNPLDDFLFDREWFSVYECEAQNKLISCAVMAFPARHKLLYSLIHALTPIEQIDQPAWVLCGPQFFTDVIFNTVSDYTKYIYPSWYFMPVHGTGHRYIGTDKIYGNHYWAGTFDKYGSLK